MSKVDLIATSTYDSKVQAALDKCRINERMLKYIENFNYPHVSEVTYYEQLLKIGQGTFGEVFKARCKRSGRLVALKKILMENEKEGFPITALREIKMLQKLRHEHITELIEVCTSKQKSGKERFCFYLVFTFCAHDLAGLLSNSHIKIRLVDIKTMMNHILRGLHKIHSSNILHRDMKAANVLITSDGVLKLADFGLARLMYKQPDYCYTNRVVTLWYRPPELLLGTRHYGPSIDIWGAGCIMAELWIRSPILQGNTEQAQLELISKLCGSINPQSWPGCEKLPYYSNLQGALQQNLPRRIRERINPFLQRWANSFLARADEDMADFAQYLVSYSTQNNEQALSLIDQMLTLCPEKRPTASHALDHNFFFEQPTYLDNISELLEQLKGTNLFEYTSGCGAHANRRRPVAPAAPIHNNNQQQQMRIKQMQTAKMGQQQTQRQPSSAQQINAPHRQPAQQGSFGSSVAGGTTSSSVSSSAVTSFWQPGAEQQRIGVANQQQQMDNQQTFGSTAPPGAMPPPNRKRPAGGSVMNEQPAARRPPLSHPQQQQPQTSRMPHQEQQYRADSLPQSSQGRASQQQTMGSGGVRMAPPRPLLGSKTGGSGTQMGPPGVQQPYNHVPPPQQYSSPHQPRARYPPSQHKQQQQRYPSTQQHRQNTAANYIQRDQH